MTLCIFIASRMATCWPRVTVSPGLTLISRMVPGIGAVNFVLERALGGGGSCSLRSDPLGKCYAQMLLDMEIDCPAALLPGMQETTA